MEREPIAPSAKTMGANGDHDLNTTTKGKPSMPPCGVIQVSGRLGTPVCLKNDVGYLMFELKLPLPDRRLSLACLALVSMTSSSSRKTNWPHSQELT